uniref:Uncharacterized protein n=1 Tax=Kalanchoe fedtschenkoi TaxID=63787 RepID=A0A7N0TPY6_KALFE
MASKSSGDNPSLLLSAVTEFLRTHPLYVSYLVFFSPYILRLLSFLSPLLLLLLLCSTSFLLHGDENASSTGSVLEVEAYKIIFENFHESLTDSADEVEVCKEMVKEGVSPEIVKSCCSSTPLPDVEKSTVCGEDELSSCMDPSPTSAGKSRNAESSNWDDAEIIKHMVCSSAVNTPEENERGDDEEKPVKAAVGAGFDKAEGPLMTATTQKSGSNDTRVDESQDESTNSTDLNKTASLKSSSSWIEAGSMRRSEKEWRRTLACKLFEERHNKGGMDMLWETYEVVGAGDDGSSRANARESDVDEDEDDDDAEEVGKMCCLQALKMSSGKVNLGIGRKNMMKLSKALRRFGWLPKTSSDKNLTRK